MRVKYVVKDLISNQYVISVHYWSELWLDKDIDEAYVWNTLSPAKGFITTIKNSTRMNQKLNGNLTMDLIVIPINVHREEKFT